MNFFNPIFLWALAGLSIPVGIHLLSRKEGKLIKLGSLRNLQETSTKQFRGIKLNEIVLLSLRCLLIIILCLLLSGLYWNSSSVKKWVVVEKGLDIRKLSLDTLKNHDYELHWLSKDFPPMTEGDTSSFTSAIPYSEVIQQLNFKQISEVLVFARNNPGEFKGPRISLPSYVRWISISSEPSEFILQRIQVNPDSIFERKGLSNAEQTYFTNEKVGMSIARGKIDALKEVSILLVSDEKYHYDKKIILASLTAIDHSFPIHLILKEISATNFTQGDSTRWIIWLSDNKLPNTLFNLIVLKVQLSNNLFEQNQINQWTITKRLTVETALNENFTPRLAEIILPDQKPLESIADKKDMRMIPDSLAWSDHQIPSEVTSALTVNTPVSPWLLTFLFFTLLMERIIAYRKNQ